MEREAGECRIAARRAARNEQPFAIREALSAEPKRSVAAIRDIVDAPTVHITETADERVNVLVRVK